MKLIALFLVCISFFSFSQNEGRHQLYRKKEKSSMLYFPQVELYRKSFIQKNKIKSYCQIVETKKGAYNSQQVLFNENRQIIKTINSEDTSVYFYKNDSILEKVITTGKQENEVYYSYQNEKISSIQTFSKGKLTSIVFREYNDDNKLVSELLQNGKRLKRSYLLKYFYDEGKLIRQSFYTGNQLTASWDYSCSNEGKKIEPKNAVSICEYVEESNDGSYIEYKRRLRDNYVFLSKKYFSKDSVLYKTEDFSSNNQLFREVLIYKDSTIRTRFDSKDRIIERHISYFDETKNMRSHKTIRGRKQNKSHTYLTFYNNQGLVSKNENINRGKTTMTLAYDYEFY